MAADRGAELVLLPENFGLMGLHARDKLAVQERDGDGPQQAFLATMAQTHKAYVIGGSVPVSCDDPARVRQTLLVYGPDGARRARYDKIHLLRRRGLRRGANDRPGRRAGDVFRTVRTRRAVHLLRPALSGAVPRTRRPGADRRARRVHRTDRRGALGDAVAGAGDREPVLRACCSAIGHASGRPAHVGTLDARRALGRRAGRSARRCRRGRRHRRATGDRRCSQQAAGIAASYARTALTLATVRDRSRSRFGVVRASNTLLVGAYELAGLPLESTRAITNGGRAPQAIGRP